MALRAALQQVDDQLGFAPLGFLEHQGEFEVDATASDPGGMHAIRNLDFGDSGLSYLHDLDTGLMGYINEKGAWAIKPAFMYTMPFHEGVAIVSKRGDDGIKFGGINTRGETVVPFIYASQPGDFSNGLAYVHHHGSHCGFMAAVWTACASLPGIWTPATPGPPSACFRESWRASRFQPASSATLRLPPRPARGGR